MLGDFGEDVGFGKLFRADDNGLRGSHRADEEQNRAKESHVRARLRCAVMNSLTNELAGCERSSPSVPFCTMRPSFMRTISLPRKAASGQIVRDENGRLLQSLKNLLQIFLQCCPNEWIERTERLVEEKKLRREGERAHEADALTLSAGKFGGKPIESLSWEAGQMRTAHRARFVCSADAPSAKYFRAR